MTDRPNRPRLLRTHAAGHPRATVCFHHAGGGTSAYQGWAPALAAHTDLVLVRLEGREDRFAEPLTEPLDRLVLELAREIDGLPHEELVLLGHSMGAALAWMAADALWTVYRRRASVVVSAQAPPPYSPAGIPGPAEAAPEGADEFHTGTLAADLAWMAREFPSFVPRPLPLDLHCVTAAGDHLVPPDAPAGWAALTTGRFTHRTVDGGHMYLLTGPGPLLALAGGPPGRSADSTDEGGSGVR
ncbi:thioesterase II family protein [Kitasatospora sp. NPDC057198]|uniref:thioesterase II family protein n=1 Tax=Kitasatospora sp. NPDC057198 TaxID=3346046 RepID=UPI00362E53C8